MAEREVDVLVQVGAEDVSAGKLWGHRRRGVESQTFRYAPQYIARQNAPTSTRRRTMTIWRRC